MASALSIGSDP